MKPVLVTPSAGMFAVVLAGDGQIEFLVKEHPTNKEASDHLVKLVKNLPRRGNRHCMVIYGSNRQCLLSRRLEGAPVK